MAGLPWFELDVDFADSPKVVALASRLRQPLADAYVARVYAYCYRHARDRFGADVACETIEQAARWKGHRGTLLDALFAVGVLEREAGVVVVHGVAERLAPHLAKRRTDAVRQRRRRAKVAESIGDAQAVTPDVTPDVTGYVTHESRRDKDKDKDKETDPPVVPRPDRPARMGVGHPGFEAWGHWQGTVWPRLSPAACPKITEREAAPLGRLCVEHTAPAVIAAMDRAAADPFWRDKLTLAALVENFARFLPRHGGPSPPRSPKCVGQDENGQPVFAESHT